MTKSSAKGVARRRAEKAGGNSNRLPGPAAGALSSSNHGAATESEVARLKSEVRRLKQELELEREQLVAEASAIIEAQQELELSRQRYVELYDSAPVGYLTLNREGCVLTANFTAGTLLHQEHTKLIGRRLMSYVVSEDRFVFNEYLVRVWRQATPLTAEIRFLAANGATAFIQLAGVRGLSTVANDRHIRVTLTDASQRRQAEADLRRSEERFRTMADSAPVLIWVSDKTGGCIWFNKPWLDFTGRPLAEESGTGWAKNVHPEDRERCLHIYQHSFELRQKFRMEYRLRRRDEEWRWVLDHGVPLGATPETFSGYIGSCVDITDRKQAELALQDKEAELRFVAGHTPVMLIRCTCDLRYKFVNQAYAEFLGSLPEQIVGRPIREVLGEAAYHTILPHIKEVLQGRPVEYETEVDYPGSGPRFVHVNYRPETDAGGEVTGWVGAITDITERERVNRRLRVRDAINAHLAAAPSLREAATRILQTLCELTDWDCGALWATDTESGEEMRCVDFWHRPAETMNEFEADTRQRRFACGHGLVGQAWSAGEPVFVADLASKADSGRTDLAHKSGLRSGFCSPLRLGKKIPGVIECYSRRQRAPDQDFFHLLTAIGSKLALFFERTQAGEALRQSENRMRHILDTALDAVITVDASGAITGWNPQAEQIFGWTRPEILGRKLAETIIPPRYGATYEEYLRRYLDTGEAPMLKQRIELEALHRSGREFPAELAVTPLAVADKISFCAFVRDITERKSAEELLHRAHDELEQRVRGRTAELAETNEKLQVTLGQMNELYHQAPCGYYSVDATGRFTKINDTALQLLGYAREELVGKKTIFDIETPASRMAGLEAFKLLKAGQAVRDLQLELVRKDGSVLTVSLNATAVLDDSGRMVRSRSAFVDVSDRVTVQQSLARSEARLQAILDFSPVVMFLKDLQGRYRLVNREFEQAFGLKQEQVLGKTDAELFPPEIAPTFQANDRAVLRTGHARTFEETVPYIGGSHVSVVVKFPLRDSSGQINALGGMAIDITQRKQAEAALRASEARFRSFVESAPDAVVIVDGDGRIQLVNARTEQMFGYRREELLGQSWERLMPARFLRGQLGKKTRHLVTPRARPTGTGLQLFGRRKGGDEFPVEISLSLLETGPGSPVCAAIRDVTVRKRMEDALRESKEHYLALFKQSRAAHREMQRLSRLVLHAQENERKRISRELHDDVGQLLTVTSMMLKGVSQDGPAQPAVDRRKLDEARRLLQTAMEKVHDFALELRPNLLDEAGLLPALRSTLSSVAEQAGLQVRLRADPSVEQLGPEEKLTLFRIAQESLNNIVKHAQASRVHATVARSAGAITLTLTDNGKSFDAKLGHQAGRRRLGLLGMKERARLVNGKFAIQGRPGKGTTVQVKIPFKKSSSSRRRAGNKPTVKNVRPDSAASLQP